MVIVYTSGTTGKPKGVMLTHTNVVSNMLAYWRARCQWSTMCFCPFAAVAHLRALGGLLPATGCWPPAIAVDPLFAQVLVVGENQSFIACVAVDNSAEWQQLAASWGVDAEADASLNLPPVHHAALARVTAQTRDFARYAIPRAIFLTREPWTAENTLMNPMLKLKRNNLMARYAGQIEVTHHPQVRQAKMRA